MFEDPKRVNFRHLYFSLHLRDSNARAETETAHAELNDAQNVKFAAA